MKFYCYTRVNGYRRFCISNFRKTDDGRYFYVFMEDIDNSKTNPQQSVYVTRENSCGLSKSSERLFTYSGCKLLTKADDSSSPSGFTLLYISNVGNASEAAKNNQSKSFIMIAENKVEDSFLRKLSCLYALSDKQISDMTYSLAYRSVLDEKVIFCFDNEKWDQLVNCINKKVIPSKYDNVLKGNKYILMCDGVPVEEFFKDFFMLDKQEQYIIEGGTNFVSGLIKKKDSFDKNRVILLMISIGTLALIGYLMLKK